MEQDLSCPLCKEKVYSKAGIGCLMCGMPLEDENVVFCSDLCEETFYAVNKKDE